MEASINDSLKALLRNYINPYNGEYLIEIYEILKKKNMNQLTIDLLNDKISTNEAKTDKLKKIIQDSRNCFIKDINKKNISVKITIFFISENEFSLVADCIIANNDYFEKINIFLKK